MGNNGLLGILISEPDGALLVSSLLGLADSTIPISSIADGASDGLVLGIFVSI